MNSYLEAYLNHQLEGVDEDRLRELQNAVQEQLRQRDEERERNITKKKSARVRKDI